MFPQFYYHITLSFSTIIILLGTAFAITALVVRYKVLTRFAQPQSLLEKHPPNVDLVDSITKRKQKPSRDSNYLDEFLSAIKIFGYLDHSVFHELTKNMTTQKLSPDEVMYMDDSVGFLIVVEGTIQVFVAVGRDEGGGEVLELEGERYQLLNEVKSGSPLLSLISTLDLFQGQGQGQGQGHGGSGTPAPIVARPKAGSGATLAIIPAPAFARIQSKYPKAAAHIVTMVKTRLFKVTFNAIHNYLGMTREILETEVNLNREARVPAPAVVAGVKLAVDKAGDGLAAAVETPPSASQSGSTAGDLLSSVPISGRGTGLRPVPVSGPRDTDPVSVLLAVVDSIFDMMGLSEEAVGLAPASSGPSRGPSRGGSVAGSVAPSAVPSAPNLPGLGPGPGLGTGPMSPFPFGDDPRGRLGSVSSLGSTVSRGASPRIYTTVIRTPRLEPQPEPRPVWDYAGARKDFSRAVSFHKYHQGDVLLERNSYDTQLYYVVEGNLAVEDTVDGPDGPAGAAGAAGVRPGSAGATLGPGCLAGYVAVCLDVKSLARVRVASSTAIVASIPKAQYHRLLDHHYWFQLPAAVRLKSFLSRSMLTIDFALEWCHIPAGDVLCAQGDVANGFHMVLLGRFRAVTGLPRGRAPTDADRVTVVDEHGHGESVGEVEVLTARLRPTSLVAVRDSETVRIPRTLFEILSVANPSIMVKVSRIVANRVARSEAEAAALAPIPPGSPSIAAAAPPHLAVAPSRAHYKTITVLPAHTGLPVREFAARLVESLRTVGRTVIALDQTAILTHLGRHAFDHSVAQLKLSGYFAYLEEQYETVVYICDTSPRSWWTSTCIGQGDCILVVAAADDHPPGTIGEFESLLVKYKTTAKTDLCLVHGSRYVVPGSTSLWLNVRPWVLGHHHVHMDLVGPARAEKGSKLVELAAGLAARVRKRRAEIAAEIAAEIKRARGGPAAPTPLVLDPVLVLDPDPDPRTHRSHGTPGTSAKNDFLRLARILSHQGVGLVLGGGGSRGISHLGVLACLEAHGIPIDFIGGTSIGAFVGGLYASEYNSVSIYGKVKKFSLRVSSYWRSVLDLTYPVTSYLTGYEFNRGIWKALGFTELEDCWIKFFCNSTNITNSTMDIHETGYCWRFIRASMSLAGLLPPIAHNGCMLLDGGYLDNLPVLEMKRRGVKHIFAVDVGSVDDRSPQNYGDTLSGFWVLWNRWNPFSTHPNVPNMMDIQLRLAYVASVNALEIAKRTPGVVYLRPPIENFGTLDFAKFDEIYRVGLEYAEKVIGEMEKKGEVPGVNSVVVKKKQVFRRNSI